MKQLLSFLPGVLLLIAIPIAGWHLLKNEKGTEATFLQNVTNKVNLTDGLVGHWTFDGPDLVQNVADVSGQGNHGRLQNFGATSTAVTEGKIGQGMSFDGSDDEINLGTSAFSSLTQGSIVAWVKASGSGTRTIFNDSGGVTNLDGQLQLYINSSGNIQFIITNTTYEARLVDATVALTNPNSWHHVVLSVNASGNSVYVDGEQQTPTYSVGNASVATFFDTIAEHGYAIGGPTDLSSENFSGVLDDVRVYNRALSAAEVQALYNMGSSLKMNVTNKTTVRNGLVGHWTFDGPDLAQNVADVSGQGNHGRLQNFGATSTAVTEGKLGQGLRFDGGDDQIDIGSQAILDDITAGDITVCVWVNPDATQTDSDTRIVSKTNSSAFSSGWTLNVFNNAGEAAPYKFQWRTRFDGLSPGGSGRWQTLNEVVTVNEWQHLCVVYNGSSTTNDPTFYRNASTVSFSETHAPNGSRVSDATDSLRIGDISGSDRSFAGSLDDVRVYNRALSETEVKQLYNMGR